MDFCFHIWNFNGLQSTTIVTKKLFLIVNWSLIDSNWYATSLHPKFALVTHNPWQILVIGTEENTLASILCSCCRYFGEAIFSISSSITRTLISSSSIPFLSRGLFFSSSLVFFFILIPSKNGQLPLEDTVLNLTCLRPSCQYRIFFTQSQARKPCVQSLDIWHLFIRNYFGLIDNHRHCKKPLSGCYKNCPYISPICVSSSSLTENFCGFSLSRSNGA